MTLAKYLRKFLVTEHRRFAHMGRLLNEYVCDQFSRLEENRLSWVRHNLQQRIAKRKVLKETIEADGGPKPGTVRQRWLLELE